MRTFLKCIVFCIAIGVASGLAENTSNEGDDVIKMLDDTSSLSDRMRGFLKAKDTDSKKINNKLVQLLDSKKGGGKEIDELVLPSWHESLIILAKRFPEAGINAEPLAYKHDDALVFKNWWFKNEVRIKYHDNSHSLVSAAASNTEHIQPFTPLPLPKVTREPASMPVLAGTPLPSTPVAMVVENPAPVVERKSLVLPWLVGILALVVIVAVALKRRA